MRIMRDNTPKRSPRALYALSFVLLLATEVLIALFGRDRFVRPYVGDMLVAVLICCFVRIFLPWGVRLLPLWVFLFSAAVEAAQYVDLVSRLGIADNVFLRTLIGTTFSWADIACYAVGCGVFFLVEVRRHRKEGVS